MVCQVSFLAVPFRPMEKTDIWKSTDLKDKSFVLTPAFVSGSRLPYRIHFHEFEKDSLGKILETDKFTVYAQRRWTTIFCVGYRVMQKDLEGTLDAEKLKAAGVPFGPLFGKIKNTARILFWNGTLKSRQQTISQRHVQVRLSLF